ncbi:hypothetical protein OIU34_16910 [Pararhizobium sp. BT-229]|uniref:hypothetical protein n=1 Tax=Pararhizobium sp. BT-229 TaxID=2986923 RepID=UPI0021F75A9E|nr:hypothetical protein [Pararhizobium sp. BT-229]MCV9963586.1 hypothetical protein [Pararhizobium sp. BT-229]
MRANSLLLIAVLILLALPISSSADVRVIKHSHEDVKNVPEPGQSTRFYTNRQPLVNEQSTEPATEPAQTQFLEDHTVVVYTVKEVDTMLGKTISDANAKIEQLTNMYNDLAKKYDALSARLDSVDHQ